MKRIMPTDGPSVVYTILQIVNRERFATRLHAVLTQDIFGHLIDFESKESRECNYMPGILKYLVNIYIFN